MPKSSRRRTYRVRTFATAACALALLLGSAAERDARAEDAPAGPPASSADALARRVHERAGGDRFDEIERLSFRFVVEDGGETRFAASHEWEPHAGRDHVSWRDGSGRDIVATVDLGTRDAQVLIDGAAAPADEADALAAQAYGRWVNDSYWLLMPIKLFDAGVVRAREPDRDSAFHEVLRLSYEQVGLTPGDTYWLFVDRESGRVARWEMVLQGQEPPAKGFSWVDYQAVGPLELALDHVSDDDSRHIRFEDVRATTR